MRRNALVGVVLLCVAPGLLLAAEPAQQSPPPQGPQGDAHIVRIEYGSSSGMCIGYCYRQTTIQATLVRSVARTNYSPNGNRDKEYPDRKSKWKITPEQWERARAAVDTESLFALPERIGCPGCVDEPVDWITVEYSDGTTKSVMCNSGGPATDIVDKIKEALAPVLSKSLTNHP